MALNQQPKRIKTLQTNLPSDIAVEIFLKLRVESVLRCKSVCKLWCSLISDTRFIKSHLAISTTKINRHRLIYSTKLSREINKLKNCNLSDVLYDNSSINNALEVDYPFKHLSNPVKIVGCCNGLACIVVDKDALFIWNPSTRISYRLPPTGTPRHRIGWYVFYGFGYDESTDDYKVVELSNCILDPCKTFVKIYSLKSGNWKETGVYPRVCSFFDFGNFCNGALHWVAGKDLGLWTIVSLDLAKETYGRVLQPVYDVGHKYMTLGTLREQLCVVCDYPGVRADLWVMKVYGVKDSWTKLVSIRYLIAPWRERLLRPLCMSNDGKMLLQFGLRKVIVYDSKNSSYSEIQDLDGCFEACTFVESLVSPMPPAAALGDI